MFIKVLKSKIHRARVTASELEYEGSIAIDSDLIKAAGLVLGEKVLVANLANGSRVETYVIEGAAGSGVVCMNGAAAHHFSVGDLVIVMSFAAMEQKEAETFQPTIVKVDQQNKVKK